VEGLELREVGEELPKADGRGVLNVQVSYSRDHEPFQLGLLLPASRNLQRLRLIEGNKLQNYISHSLVLRDRPGEVSDLLALRFKEFQWIEVVKDYTLEGFSILKFGEESLEGQRVSDAKACIALESLHGGEPSEVLILHHLICEVGQVPIPFCINPNRLHSLKLSEDLNILFR